MNTQQQIEAVIKVFEGFQMPKIIGDQFQEKGRQALSDKISPFIIKNREIEFVMLGYPMKSPNNRDKTIGVLPDLGEQLSIENFSTFDKKVKEIYEPGIHISVVSDGYVFSDIMGVDDKIVNEYEEYNIGMTYGADAPLTWYDLKDFYDVGIVEAREKLMKQFGISDVELRQRILFDQDTNLLYRGMIKFIELDLAINKYDSNRAAHREAKRVTNEMMLRNEAYSAMIRSEFKDSVRLSMHPSINNGTKFSFQLLPSPNAWTSPWHSAILINKDGGFETIHRRDAELAGHELVVKNGRPFYFQEK